MPSPSLPAFTPNRSMPDAAVLPQLAYPDVAAAAEWLARAFGFSVRLRIGGHRVQMTVPGGGGLVITQGDAAPSSVMVRVAASTRARRPRGKSEIRKRRNVPASTRR